MPRSIITIGLGPGGAYVEFLKLVGQPLRSADIIQPFDREGVDGLGFRRIARRGEPFRLYGLRDYDDMATATTQLIELQQALQGKPCTITDSSGVDHENMVCLRVRPGEPRPVLAGVGGLSQYFGAIADVEMEFVDRS